MRVTGGELAGRKLRAVPRGVRPTSDRVRESLFAWLGVDPGTSVLDPYAGTGALGIEALSRGAAAAIFVERAPAALRVLQANLEDLGLSERSEVRRGSALPALRRLAHEGARFDLVLLDPPYASEELERVLPLLEQGTLLAPEGVVVVERSRRAGLPELAVFRVLDTRRYGETEIDVLCRGSVE